MKVDAMAVNKNPIKRRLAEAFAFLINESEATPLLYSTVKPNPAAEPESIKYDMICPLKIKSEKLLKLNENTLLKTKKNIIISF